MQKVQRSQEMSPKPTDVGNTNRAVGKVSPGRMKKGAQRLQPGMVSRPPNGDPSWAMLWGEDS